MESGKASEKVGEPQGRLPAAVLLPPTGEKRSRPSRGQHRTPRRGRQKPRRRKPPFIWWSQFRLSIPGERRPCLFLSKPPLPELLIEFLSDLDLVEHMTQLPFGFPSRSGPRDTNEDHLREPSHQRRLSLVFGR
ncbi:unnamed protein product [Darwinula stevensoni]|uniref:Uncharacterized protein n=1 Tax=Darwinula stevensoni TaxID=69355 RepID=A0A7R9A3N0_9CRUS|nr:unnamed protein product [Darwinula stevensoni]CAG0891953.1 unnamed protein product [Darwinula stevensoni]